MSADFNQLLLLGLSIDEGCDPHMKKCLETGVVYPFYSWFKVSDGDRKVICAKNPLPVDFFSGVTRTPLLSFSAIVGSNGSGKSSLSEIILRLLNNLSFILGQEFNREHNFSFIEGLRASLYYSLGDKVFRLIQFGDTKEDMSLEEYDEFDQEWRAVYMWHHCMSEDFFYNVFLNYSIYALNSHDFNDDRTYPESRRGRWIDSCFHKNDGYLAPITLNPLRTNGNIEVNNERHLAKSRLISLLFTLPKGSGENFDAENVKSNAFTYISKRLSISAIDIRLDQASVDKKYQGIFKEWEKRDNFTPDQRQLIESCVVNAWKSIYHFNDGFKDDVVYHTAIKYLIYKTISVANTYNAFDYFYALSPIYHGFKNKRDWKRKIFLLIDEINKDTSHITFRLKQTLAFLIFRQYDVSNDEQVSISIEDFSSTIQKLKSVDLSVWSVLDFVPPPVFKTELMIKDRRSTESFFFSRLSSGEQQLIYSLSAILYHLRNIDSVPDNFPRRTKYQHVNILLDEIELYFHPEYQRKFVKRLRDAIREFPLESIRSINVMMITHSPFILSDIPKSNVLFLKDGHIVNSMQENTFAANIHSIFQNGFFLENGTIGEFAREKVNDLFGQLHEAPFSPHPGLRQQILLVSEPILRSQLLRMYNDLYGENEAQARMWAVINDLSQQISKLRNDRNR